MKHSQELRATVTRKVLEGGRSQELIAAEFGIGRSTIQNWLRQDRRSGVTEVVKRERRPEDWTAQERLSALNESSALSDDELGAWCRGQGLHTHHLERWRREMIEGQERKGSQSTLRALRAENRSLKKELRRKEKALAETAALLVLKKKAAAIWGEPEDD